jgi:hypothetical protein
LSETGRRDKYTFLIFPNYFIINPVRFDFMFRKVWQFLFYYKSPNEMAMKLGPLIPACSNTPVQVFFVF